MQVVQLVLELLRVDYPSSWPSFFHDLVSTLGQGPGMVDMFARVLLQLDEEIISMEVPRSQEEGATSMRVKDAIRESCIALLVDTVHKAVLNYQESAPALAGNLLEVFSRFITWVDIGLVANEHWMSLLVGSLSSPSEAVRSGALDCVLQV
jgi:exportin-T